MAGEDFVHARLTAAGEQMAGKGAYVRIAVGRCDFTFKPGQTKRITKAYEWPLLKSESYKGQPIFEIVLTPENEAPAPLPAPPAAPAPTAGTK
jgi:hypothetical protein